MYNSVVICKDTKKKSRRRICAPPPSLRKMSGRWGEAIRRTTGGKNVREEIVSPLEVAADLMDAVESLTEARRAVRRQMNSPLTPEEEMPVLKEIEIHIWDLERFATSTACEMVDEGMWKKEEDEK